MIQDGEKTVESRLFDIKRQQVQLGDELTFYHVDDPSRMIRTKVIGLLRYATFDDMFSHNDPRKFGGENAESLTEQIRAYYSYEDQNKYGVLGIEIQLI
ncbi:hypothetical protein D3C86_1671570 [compost metagenome]